MDLASLLNMINEKEDTSFQLVSKFKQGTQGAFTIQDHAGNEFVLKWGHSAELTSRLDEAAAYTSELKRKGYPLPLYTHIGHTDGWSYSIQEKLAGTLCPPENLPVHLPRILEINELQRDQVKSSHWPERIVNAVIYGESEFCSHQPLLHFSSATAELLIVLQNVMYTYDRHTYRTTDIVHFDFHHQNLLVHEGQLSGVVDWQFPCAGDCTFDLLTLMLYTEPDSKAWNQLKQAAERHVGKDVASIYLSYLLLRQICWCIEHWPAWLDHWFRVAKKALD
ncbi:aminoglycoside phosphotransferase family protein [Paenibacillus hexagrammi]|uniref:Aminoglycoside phosphotransferase family protein n=1 Tax=Paenibacillus hexagrammi TaxID=2908839 RepID=A0ABY3SJA9_9BACL|nr:aminoglycoside phosphotransferase family protein [Paenibacillus sp. YPD9-1]UJF34031.1 aminoglycoside phosphotransferase family protein [Paenibacillus sp. YPD9-1]